MAVQLDQRVSESASTKPERLNGYEGGIYWRTAVFDCGSFS